MNVYTATFLLTSFVLDSFCIDVTVNLSCEDVEYPRRQTWGSMNFICCCDKQHDQGKLLNEKIAGLMVRERGLGVGEAWQGGGWSKKLRDDLSAANPEQRE